MDFSFAVLTRLLEQGDAQAAQQAVAGLAPEPREQAAELALALGRPSLALAWSRVPLTRAAAGLRLGAATEALSTLEDLPAAAAAAVAALRARAEWQLGRLTLEESLAALQLARQQNDHAAVVALATLRGEQQLATPFAALRSLAEGLKTAELTGQAADAHLLAVLAHAQRRAGGTVKAERSAVKALGRSAPRSPARLVALLALGRTEEAAATAQAGELGEIWQRPFSP